MPSTEYFHHLEIAQNQVWTDTWMWREAPDKNWTTSYVNRHELTRGLWERYGEGLVTVYKADGTWDWFLL